MSFLFRHPRLLSSPPLPILPYPYPHPHTPVPTFPSDLDKIISSGQGLTDQHFQYFLYQILRSLKYVHSANVIHRDLKPANLLVNANCDLALCDFGLSRGVDLDDTSAADLTTYVVTRWYRAPELLCDTGSYGKGVDVWSVGCIFAEMITRKTFFAGSSAFKQLEEIVKIIGADSSLDFVVEGPSNKKSTIENILRHPNFRLSPLSEYLPRGTNPLAVDLLSKMLCFDPSRRATVEECLAHPYLRELHSSMPEPLCDGVFNFEFESVGEGAKEGGTLGKEDLQDMMFQEMLQLREQMFGGGADSYESSLEFSAEGKDSGMDVDEVGEEDGVTVPSAEKLGERKNSFRR